MDKQEFLQWKDKYWSLYYVEIEGYEFLFRELSRSEYKKGVRLYDDDTEELEEYICRLCILEPEGFDFENCIAGIPTSLANMILFESGFTEDTGKLATYMEKYEAEMTTLDNQISCIIKEAFPEKDIEEIENWPMEKTIWYYSRAKYILNSLRGLDLIVQTAGDEAPAPSQQRVAKPTNTQAPPAKEEKKFDFKLGGEGTVSDFPELAEVNAFMKGRPLPPRQEGEELL